MPRKVKPATQDQSDRLSSALRMLRHARDLIASADCPETLAKVRAAITSAEGAERHMLRRLLPRDPETGEPLRSAIRHRSH